MKIRAQIGMVLNLDKCIGCHNSTGKAKGAPACIDLKTYPVKLEAGRVWLRIGEAPADRPA